MQCPACKTEVMWQRGAPGSGSFSLFDVGPLETFEVDNASDEIIEMGWGRRITAHTCPSAGPTDQVPAWENEADYTWEERRDAWWTKALEYALNDDCPEGRCSADAGDKCRHLTREDRAVLSWPHATRISVTAPSKFYAYGREMQWV